MRLKATSRLEQAEAGDDAAAVRAAFAAAEAVGVAAEALARGRARLEELTAESERQARRESLGVGRVPACPDEFNCPITFCKMADPIVASDGHSYERAALQSLFERAAAGHEVPSPLTREPLRRDVIIPNIALRKRIESHSQDELRIAEAARAAIEAEAQTALAAAVAQGRAEGRAEGEAAERKRQLEASAASSSSAGGDGGGVAGSRPKRARR